MSVINYSNVTKINETIKDIVRISRQVNLAALNAMFLSRKGGSRTVGFASVTTEMRKFSHGLDNQMQRLADSLNQLIYALSLCKKAEHTQALMHIALEQSRQFLHDEVHLSINLRNEQKIMKIMHLVDEASLSVFKELEKSSTICSVGENLAVLAKIESQSGGEYESGLMNVANTIENIIEKINLNLQQAKRYTGNNVA